MSMDYRMVQLSPSSKFIWRIENYSQLLANRGIFSDFFSVGGCEWRVQIYPKGDNESNFFEAYLYAKDPSKLPYAEFCFAIVNQNDDFKSRFTNETGWGFDDILPLSELDDPDKGYVVNDSCIFTVEVSACSMILKSTDNSKKVVASNQTEAELQALVPVKVLTPVPLNNKAEVSSEAEEHPVPGQRFDEGEHNRDCVFSDERFENVGGFTVLKTQASLYKQIWMKYGHLSSNKIMVALSYITQVWIVVDIMNFITDMHQCRFVDLSSQMIDLWDEKIKMAEKLELNIRWLRECFENVKEVFNGMQKFKTIVLEHGQPFWAAKMQVITAEDELKKAQAQLIAKKDEFRENMSTLLSDIEIEMYLENGDKLLFDEML